ncbi:MAG: RDD family protein [Dehalococcoidia bacterium]|nr:MAG: RDD family protein [Dehalococcoidia bacterium]
MEQTTGAHALEYAGFWRRFAAFFIDALILSLVVRVLFPFQSFWNLQNAWFFIFLAAISNLASTAITVAYTVGFWVWRGQTLGKMVMNIKVLRGDGSNITIGYALLRYLGYIVCGLMLGIGFLWIALDARKQGIHDKIADTVVVKLPEPTRTQTALASPRPSAS